MIRTDYTRSGENNGFALESIEFTGTSEPVWIRACFVSTSVAVHPSAGTARIEYTLSAFAHVEADTARWIEWPLGDVSISTADSLMACVTAIRGVSTHACVMEICST